MARLDRLGPAKEVAQIGAVSAAVARRTEAELQSTLNRLIWRGRHQRRRRKGLCGLQAARLHIISSRGRTKSICSLRNLLQRRSSARKGISAVQKTGDEVAVIEETPPDIATCH